MAEKSTFGIDKKFLDNIDFELAIERIISDLKSDFIIAPHLSCIYSDAKEELVNEVKSLLLSGKFSPQLPISIDVPKKQRINYRGIKRLPPNFVRPGSILWPRDRLLYQALADIAQPIIESKLNRDICFSHLPSEKSSNHRMFRASRDCWSSMQNKLAEYATKEHPIVLKADIASCFQSINQHTLVNTLEAIGYPNEGKKPLESMLTQMSSSRSSRGIIQGVFPSDLFGNFYLYPIDRYISDNKLPSVRYVDDIYVFFKSHEECDKFIVGLYRELRKLDLNLNEAKSCVTTPAEILTSDPDLEALFSTAIEEIHSLYEDGGFEEVYTDYGFQTIWVDYDTEINHDEINLTATQLLFDEINKYPSNTEEIERFCLPMFAAFNSDYALDEVLNKIESTPSMSQIYFSYLSNFLDNEKVTSKIESILSHMKLQFEWEYLWVLACAIKIEKAPDSMVSLFINIAMKATQESVVALAWIAAAKHGDYDRQKTVVDAIEMTHSNYIRGAILFSARYMSKPLKKITIDLLENQNELFKMITISVNNAKV